MDTLLSLDRFDRPWCLWIALVAVLFWWLSRRSLAGLGPIRSKLCMATRALVIVLLVLALAGTHKILKNDDLNVMFLFDVSKSVPEDIRRQAEQFVMNACSEMKPDDRAALLTFDGLTNIQQLPTRPGLEGGIHTPPPFPDGQKPDQTNMEQGVRMAIACASDDLNNRVVILSDGNQNVGDVLEEARSAYANNITIDVLPLHVEHGAEVVLEQLRAPPYANLHENIPLRLILKSDRPTSGEILIYQRVGPDEQQVDINTDPDKAGVRVQLRPGRNPFTVPLPITTQRAHEFRAEFIPDDRTADVITENNVARAFTNVEGPQTVLFIGGENDRSDDALLVEALGREEIRVDWVTAESVDLSPSVLQDYASVILSNVGADYFSGRQQQALASYVRDLGGGLIMVGGDDSFGAGGWQGSVVEEVMPVKFDVDAVRQIPRGALAIVMHSCEMPQGNKWGIETAVAALKTVSRLDYFGIVGWGMNGFHWEVKMQVATNKDAITQKIRKMQNSDMFDFQTPMNMAYKALMNCKDAAQRHMIIISDGDPQHPGYGLLNKMRGNKVTCSTVSVFPHSGREIGTMKDIAKKTRGRYYHLGKPGDENRLPKIFTKEAKVVRRPLIRDELFTPKLRPNLSDIMIGIDGPFPPLKGYVVTTPRKVSDVEMPLVTKRGDPLLAHWLCGFGRTVAFTSGRWKHWGDNWAGWASFSKLWAQAVRWSMQQGTAADYDVTTMVDGDEGHLIIESMDDTEGAANYRPFLGRLISPEGTAKNLALSQTGPGRFEARFPVTQKGTYLINVQAPGSKKQKAAIIRTGVTQAYSPEYKDLTVNEALLTQLSEAARGRVLTPSASGETVFAHNLPKTIARTPIWDTLFKLAIIAFLLDVAFRRIAIDPIKALAFTRGYIAGLAGRFGAGKRAEATLTDLRSVRERVRGERTAEGDTSGLKLSPPHARTAEPPAAGPSAGAKFDAGDAIKKPAKDLSEAMGGHQAEPPPKGVPKKKVDQPQESMTARLLKAKRRAKERQDENE